MILFKIAGQFLGLISTVILARLLLPAEFGIVAMAMSVIGVLEMMRSFSFDAMLIQKQDADRTHYDTAWTFNVLLGLLVAFLLVVLAGPTASFYGEPALTLVVYVLAIGTAIQGFENIGIVDLRKNMQFNRDFRFLMLRRLSGFVVTVPLAFLLRNYWALVAGMMATRLTSVLSSYWMSDYRPRFTMRARAELFGFSVWLFFLNLLEFAWVRSADFIIGRIAGARMLGIFRISYQLSNLPATELVAPINRAIFPGYALVSRDTELLKKGYLGVLSIVSLLSVPAGFGIAVVAPILVAVVLGPSWADAAPVMAVLALFGVTSALLGNAGSIFKAIGKPQFLMALAALRFAVLLPVLILATREFGVIGAAYSYLIVSLVFMPLIYFVLFKLLHVTVREFLNVVWRPILGAVVMYAGVERYLSSIEIEDVVFGKYGALVSAVVLGGLIYFITVVLAWLLAGRPDGGESTIMSRLPRKRT